AQQRRLSRNQPVGSLDQSRLATEPPHHLCHLDTGRSTAEHEQPARERLHAGRLPRTPYPVQSVEPGDGWHEGIRARRDHHVISGVPVALDLDDAMPGESTDTTDE